ncbi:hypothetical protein [Marinobacterium stanieri]|uniref:Uncharacterized protein n=1 Tax=Marinobacterium stanieri TaxID=49186 RepID=A0A1N6Q3L7_9GAMM|nr:hypothetical protein [Marinobacterium stanieri]SIQ11173.1 hypothetical protein SAMN05421647_102230 [Marinobacterium stanieri]
MKKVVIAFIVGIVLSLIPLFGYDAFLSSLDANIVSATPTDIGMESLYCAGGLSAFGFISTLILLTFDSKRLIAQYAVISVVALLVISFIKINLMIPDTENALFSRDVSLYTIPYYLTFVVVPVFFLSKAFLNRAPTS